MDDTVQRPAPAAHWAHHVPKVVLHDHLDGGVRPATVLELAEAGGYRGLGRTDARELARVLSSHGAGSLERYLEPFAHTTAVLAGGEALSRVAREAAEDLATDGVVYAEVRFAPELHTHGGLALDEAVAAVCAGLADGERSAARAGTPLRARLIVCAMRHGAASLDAARAAAAGGPMVVGFDLAGPEQGHPAAAHRRAIDLAATAGLGITVHAGEACGPESVLDALDAGAQRVGHGIALAADPTGPAARRVLRSGVALEVCPSSNVHTGAVASLGVHPVEELRRRGFTVTLSPDNRLMSATSAGDELERCARAWGWTPDVAHRLADDALAAAFCDDGTRAWVRRRLDVSRTVG